MLHNVFFSGVCLFTMTTEILFVAFGEWILGALACKLIVYGQIVTLASATFLLTGMAIDRYATMALFKCVLLASQINTQQIITKQPYSGGSSEVANPADRPALQSIQQFL